MCSYLINIILNSTWTDLHVDTAGTRTEIFYVFENKEKKKL